MYSTQKTSFFPETAKTFAIPSRFGNGWMEGPSAADDFGGSRWPSHRARVPCCAKSLGKGEEGSVLMITSARKSATFHEVLLCFLSDSVQDSR